MLFYPLKGLDIAVVLYTFSGAEIIFLLYSVALTTVENVKDNIIENFQVEHIDINKIINSYDIFPSLHQCCFRTGCTGIPLKIKHIFKTIVFLTID